MSSESVITHTGVETKQVGKNFAKEIRSGGVICLYGNLGAGKTTFTQGLAQGLGIIKRIISPTFVIIRTYTMKNATALYHVDLYRLTGEKDVFGIGLLEVLADKNAVVVIEWPEKMENLLPQNRWDIHIAYMKNDKREITIKKQHAK